MMPSNAPGVNDGASRMSHVTISLLVAWKRRASSRSVQGVGAAGVGSVVRNSALYTTILRRA